MSGAPGRKLCSMVDESDGGGRGMGTNLAGSSDLNGLFNKAIDIMIEGSI
jgi:hypothetical protein